MPSANKPLSNYEFMQRENLRTARALSLVYFILAVGALTALLLGGCGSPVVPAAVPAAREASFDGNAQNSGIVSSSPAGFVVTEHFRARHNALIAKYGGDFAPALRPDHGLAPLGEGRWLMSKQAMIDFLEMNAWRRAGLAPKASP